MLKHPPVQTVFGRRLREARLRAGIAQDRLGVTIGLDESCSSARMSRYETGIHEPPFPLAEKIAHVLGVPAAYLYCNDDRLAEIMLVYTVLADNQRQSLLEAAVGLRGNGAKKD